MQVRAASGTSSSCRAVAKNIDQVTLIALGLPVVNLSGDILTGQRKISRDKSERSYSSDEGDGHRPSAIEG